MRKWNSTLGAALASLAVAASLQAAASDATPFGSLSRDDKIAKYYPAADAGDPFAQSVVGSALIETGRKGDLERGEQLLLKSAGQGYDLAIFALGSLYRYNSKLRDPMKSIFWLSKGAEAGDASTQWALGSVYFDGAGVPADYRKALYWFTKAAQQGDVDAQNALGNMYLEGKGVPRQYDKAIPWLRKAATQGKPRALRSLGHCYELGLGVSKSTAAAHVLYNLALAAGEEEASEALSRVELKLPAAQISVAQRLAATWVKGRPLPIPGPSAKSPDSQATPAARQQKPDLTT